MISIDGILTRRSSGTASIRFARLSVGWSVSCSAASFRIVASEVRSLDHRLPLGSAVDSASGYYSVSEAVCRRIERGDVAIWMTVSRTCKENMPDTAARAAPRFIVHAVNAAK